MIRKIANKLAEEMFAQSSEMGRSLLADAIENILKSEPYQRLKTAAAVACGDFSMDDELMLCRQYLQHMADNAGAVNLQAVLQDFVQMKR